MMRSIKAALLVVFLVLGPAAPATAQDDDACPLIVETALQEVGNMCGDLGRDEACYGNNRVDAEFWETRDDLVFAVPSDVVALSELKWVNTARLNLADELWGVAVLSLQANLPDVALAPGQAVTFLLMGEASMESAVEPDAVAAPGEPVAAAATARVNLRSGPSTANNVIDTVDEGTELMLVGVNTAGDWYEVTGDVWVAGAFVAVEDAAALADLPVTEGEPRYGPMQAFYFSAGVGVPECSEAPNALVVQSPDNVRVAFNVNGVDVLLGSTAVFTEASVTTSGGDSAPALMMSLVEGHLHAEWEDQAFDLAEPGDAAGVTLNAAGQVDADSEIVQPDPAMLGQKVDGACGAAAQLGLVTGAACDVWASLIAPEDALSDSSSAGGGAAAHGDDAPCTVLADHKVNRRGGPCTGYPLVGELASGETAEVTGWAWSLDGMYVWWQVGDSWVRRDVVSTSGACDAVPEVEDIPPLPGEEDTSEPPASSESASQPQASAGSAEVWTDPCMINHGGVWPSTLPANTPLTIVAGMAAADTSVAGTLGDGYFRWELIIDGVVYGDSEYRRASGAHVNGYWHISGGLPPGQHHIVADEHFLTQWEWSPGQFDEAGSYIHWYCDATFE